VKRGSDIAFPENKHSVKKILHFTKIASSITIISLFINIKSIIIINNNNSNAEDSNQCRSKEGAVESGYSATQSVAP